MKNSRFIGMEAFSNIMVFDRFLYCFRQNKNWLWCMFVITIPCSVQHDVTDQKIYEIIQFKDERKASVSEHLFIIIEV